MSRQSEYKPEYCELLIEHMKEGFSYGSFAGVVGTCRKTLYNWEKDHPEFKEAKDRGECQSLLFWERQSKAGLWDVTEFENGKPIMKRSLNSIVWIFNMKNRFGWRDKQPEETPQIISQPQEKLSKDEKLERSLKIRERLKAKK